MGMKREAVQEERNRGGGGGGGGGAPAAQRDVDGEMEPSRFAFSMNQLFRSALEFSP